MSNENEKPYDGDTVRDGVTIVGRLTSRRVKGGVLAIAALLAMTGVAYVTAKAVTPDVVVFDMKGTVDLFIQQSSQMKLDEAKAGVLTARFNTALNDSLRDWQADNQAIVLAKPAVISTQPDITAEIQADIARRMQEDL